MTNEELTAIFEESKERTRRNLELLRAQRRIRSERPRKHYVATYERDPLVARLVAEVAHLHEQVAFFRERIEFRRDSNSSATAA